MAGRASAVTVDKYRLDEEYEQVVEDLDIWTARAARAKNKFNEAEAALVVITAEVKLDVYTSPAKYRLPKVVKDLCDAAVDLNKKVRAAVKVVNDARLFYDLCQGKVRTLDSKVKAIGDLIDLHYRDYFSTPRVKIREGGRAKRRTDAITDKVVYSRTKQEEE